MTQESSKAKDESSKAKASAKTEKDRAAKQQSAEPSETEQSDVFESDMKKLEDAGEDTEELRRQYLLRALLADGAAVLDRRPGRHVAWALTRRGACRSSFSISPPPMR